MRARVWLCIRDTELAGRRSAASPLRHKPFWRASIGMVTAFGRLEASLTFVPPACLLLGLTWYATTTKHMTLVEFSVH